MAAFSGEHRISADMTRIPLCKCVIQHPLHTAWDARCLLSLKVTLIATHH